MDFAAGRTPGTASTYQSSDVITGQGGANVLNLTLTNAAVGSITAMNAPAVNGMNTVNIRNVSGQAFFATGAGNGYAVSNLGTGVTAINNSLSTGAVFLEGVANTTSVGIIGNGVITNGAIEVTYAAAATSPVLNISGGTVGTGAVTITAAGATSFVINSTKGLVTSTDATGLNVIGALAAPGAATSTMTINAASSLTTGAITTAVKQITLTGAARVVTLGAITDANLTTIDASGMTAGGVSVALLDTITSFIGGAGVDTVTTVATLGATAAISGGAGAGDILNIVAGDTTSISTAALAGRFTNFEVLRNTGGGATASVANVAGITAIQLGATGQGMTGMNAAQAAAVTNRADNDTLTLALTTATGTSDVLTVTLLNAADVATSADLTTATVAGFETMNVISSSGGVGDINALSFAATTNLATLALSGVAPISVTTTNIARVGGTAINASGVTFAGTTATSAFSITGNLLKGSTVVGSSTIDTIVTTAAITGVATDFVTYDAGAGNDSISTTVAAINNNGAATGSVKIDGGLGTDTLILTGNAPTLVDANFQFLTNLERISYITVLDQAFSLTSGGFFNTSFATGVNIAVGLADNNSANVINLSTYAANATITLNVITATTEDQAITTGSGADNVTVTATATTTGDVVISTQGGNDTISVIFGDTALAVGAVQVITGGTGQDAMTVTRVAVADRLYVAFNFAAGDSTLAAADSITGYGLAGAATRGNTLNFDGTTVAAADVAGGAVAGYTAAELTYTTVAGLMTFAGTSAAGLTAAQKATVAQLVITTADNAVVFTDGANSFVFDNDAAGDSLVQLVGVTALGLQTIAATTDGFVTVA